jgi:hypothetical protein
MSSGGNWSNSSKPIVRPGASCAVCMPVSPVATQCVDARADLVVVGVQPVGVGHDDAAAGVGVARSDRGDGAALGAAAASARARARPCRASQWSRGRRWNRRAAASSGLRGTARARPAALRRRCGGFGRGGAARERSAVCAKPVVSPCTTRSPRRGRDRKRALRRDRRRTARSTTGDPRRTPRQTHRRFSAHGRARPGEALVRSLRHDSLAPPSMAALRPD